jgi:hypothetical protein
LGQYGTLHLTTPSGQQFVIELDRPFYTIGRHPSSDITIDDNLASRNHARIECDQDSCQITDMGSRNGVFVNGERVQGTFPLVPGMDVRIGQHHFRYVSPGLPQPAAGAGKGDSGETLPETPSAKMATPLYTEPLPVATRTPPPETEPLPTAQPTPAGSDHPTAPHAPELATFVERVRYEEYDEEDEYPPERRQLPAWLIFVIALIGIAIGGCIAAAAFGVLPDLSTRETPVADTGDEEPPEDNASTPTIPPTSIIPGSNDDGRDVPLGFVNPTCGNSLLDAGETCERDQLPLVCSDEGQASLTTIKDIFGTANLVVPGPFSSEEALTSACGEGFRPVTAFESQGRIEDLCEAIIALNPEDLPTIVAELHPARIGAAGLSDLDACMSQVYADVTASLGGFGADSAGAMIWCLPEEAATDNPDLWKEARQTRMDSFVVSTAAVCQRIQDRLDSGEPSCGDDQSCNIETCACEAAPVACGDGTCQVGENPLNCSRDCPTVCGDGVVSGKEQCEGDSDCASNAYCANPDQGPIACTCVVACGDGTCFAGREAANTCAADCPAICGDGFITHSEVCEGDRDCGVGGYCNSCASCSTICGDGLIGFDEVCETTNNQGCSAGTMCSGCGSCTPICGDNICLPGEAASCPKDCFTPIPPSTSSACFCGNGVCDSGTGCNETTSNCPGDCP